jgi:hypothetical protein
MTESATPPVTLSSTDGAVTANVDASVFDRRAILTAAHGFIDRAFVSMEQGDGRVSILLSPKEDAPLSDGLGAELVDALWAARLSGQLFANGRDLVERVTLRALGTPDAELEGGALLEIPPLSAEDLAAFEDPLGIAQSWEEKYAKKEPPGDG